VPECLQPLPPAAVGGEHAFWRGFASALGVRRCCTRTRCVQERPPRQVVFILASVGGNLRYASIEDSLTANYDQPTRKIEAQSALLAAHDKLCLPSTNAASALVMLRHDHKEEVGEEEAAMNEQRSRNRATAVRACSETMLPSLVWMSGHLRHRMVAMQRGGPPIDWMGQCNPAAPASVWPGALAWHGDPART
jgi:hypothetical protein